MINPNPRLLRSHPLLTPLPSLPLSALQTGRRHANVINSQMKLSQLSDGLVNLLPEEEMSGGKGGTAGVSERNKEILSVR